MCLTDSFRQLYNVTVEFVMSRPSRLFRLLQAMRVMPAPITARALAMETEVSLRTLYRDIESLRSAGARIEGERGYGYRLTEDLALPPQMLDRGEMEALALGLSVVQHMGDASLARSARSVLAKVAATLPDGRDQQLVHAISTVYQPKSRALASVDLDVLRKACWKEQALFIHYKDRDDQESERLIYPLTLVYTEYGLTLLAWCCLREGFRMFRGNRFVKVEDGGKSFRPRRVPLLRDYLSKLQAANATHNAATAGQRT